MKKGFKISALCGAAILMLLLIYIKIEYGGGKPYSDLSTAPLKPESELREIASLDFPPGNVAVSASGRIFFNYHPFAKAERFEKSSVFELVEGKPQPYPNDEFQSKYQGVFGMTVDPQQRLWFIEPSGLDHPRTRLLAFDLSSNKLSFEYWFPKGELPFAQDLRVTTDGATVILADTGLFKFTDPALAIFDIKTKTYRKVLSKNKALNPQDWVMRTPFGPHRLGFGLITFAVGVDGIEVSSDGQWLYFGAMTHERLFRVPLNALVDPKIDEITLGQHIEDVGQKPMSDGITIDSQGRILITDIEHGGIARLDPSAPPLQKLQTLIKSPKIIWADGIVVAPDGSILFTDSAIPAYIDQLTRPPSEAMSAV